MPDEAIGRERSPETTVRPTPRRSAARARTGEAQATKHLTVRVTEAELAAFDAQCVALGVKRNFLLRAMIRRASGYVEVDKPVAEELRAITRQISGVATNVNQIARAANRGEWLGLAAFLEERASLGRQLARVEALMQRVLEYAARRSDGRRQLSRLIRDE